MTAQQTPLDFIQNLVRPFDHMRDQNMVSCIWPMNATPAINEVPDGELMYGLYDLLRPHLFNTVDTSGIIHWEFDDVTDQQLQVVDLLRMINEENFDQIIIELQLKGLI